MGVHRVWKEIEKVKKKKKLWKDDRYNIYVHFNEFYYIFYELFFSINFWDFHIIIRISLLFER